MKTISLTPNYRLVIDSNQHVVQKLHEIDPTKAPNFDPEKHSAEMRREWKDSGYYSLSSHGLAAALEHVIIREAGTGEGMSLYEYAKSIHELSGVMEAAIKASLPKVAKT